MYESACVKKKLVTTDLEVEKSERDTWMGCCMNVVEEGNNNITKIVYIERKTVIMCR